MLDALLALFDLRSAAGAGDRRSDRRPHGDRLPELDARILGLLLAGLTDHAVANQLGLSMRSVQRRIRALMDLVAAETRLQLGFHAARRGWL
jgi:DNA-binding NarL/FixJ family response regulator